jgi:hypothetical protein
MVPESVVANFVKAAWQDMQQKTTQELDAVGSTRAKLACPSFFMAERHVCLVDRDQASIRQSDSKDVSRQILYHCVLVFAVRLDEAAPRPVPDASRALAKQIGMFFFKPAAELDRDFFRQQFYRDQKRTFRITPTLPVGRNATGADQEVYMWMVGHLSSPRVKHAEYRRFRAEIPRVEAKLFSRTGSVKCK